MTTQEAYDKIKRYFSKPGAVLATMRTPTGHDCLYLSDTGRKCAVGCLIPAGLYDPHFEGKGCDEVIMLMYEKDETLTRNTFGDVDMGFLSEAQEAHDRQQDQTRVADFLSDLDMIAEAYHLELTAEPAFTRETYDHYDDPTSDDFRVP